MRRLLGVLAIMLIGSQIAWAFTGDGAKPVAEQSVTMSDWRWVSPIEVTRLSTEGTDARKGTLPGHDDFIEVTSMPVLTKEVQPIYPPKAKKKGIDAALWVQALVDREGRVLAARVSKATGLDPDLGFERAALVATMDMEFDPAIQDGKPVAVWVAFKIAFKMS